MDMSSLNKPSSYPHEIEEVDWRETHISWVVLTGEFAYKIKKPVDFGFLNFSSLALRKKYCEEEVRLNRRTAPSLYLGVVALYDDHGCLNFKGQGVVIDYAVKMRQFDPDALLSKVLDSTVPTTEFIQQLAYGLAGFHQQAAQASGHYDALNAVKAPVQENFKQIRTHLPSGLDVEQIDLLERWSSNALASFETQFQQRFKQGRVRECHGDLHLGNIAVLVGKPVLFDCIEFNEQFRWIDTVSDLAFLVMDLDINGFPELANGVLNRYLEFSYDYAGLELLDFYLIYRAMVRAKVALLRLSQAGESSSECSEAHLTYQRYLQFALERIQPKKAYLAMTSGVSGSGKSTFATRLCAQTRAIHLKSDVVRKHLVGLKPMQSSADKAHLNLYTAKYSRDTFDQLLQLAKRLVQVGYGVMVDATFLTIKDRQPFLSLAEELSVPCVICHLHLTEPVLQARINARQQQGLDASEASVQVMHKQLSRVEPFTASENSMVVQVSSSTDDAEIKKVRQRITQQSQA